MGFREDNDMKFVIIVSSIFGGIGLLMVALIICSCVPSCYLASQARRRRAQLQAGGAMGPAQAQTFIGQPGTYPQGQYGGQPMMYNTAHPSQQQFNPPPYGSPQATTTPVPPNTSPTYPTQLAV